MTYTDQQLIEKYLECKAVIAKRQAQLDDGFSDEDAAMLELVAEQIKHVKDYKVISWAVTKLQELSTGIKQYQTGMTTIENEFLRRLDERGAQNTKTDAGTAYKSTITNYAVTDQTAFLDYCLAHRAQGALDMLGIKAVKDPVKEWANGGNPPPGLEQSQRINVHIRRS